MRGDSLETGLHGIFRQAVINNHTRNPTRPSDPLGLGNDIHASPRSQMGEEGIDVVIAKGIHQ